MADPELSTFVELVKAAGLEALLSGADVYTVFAPTNAYFNALPLVTLDALKANKLKLRDQLLGHLVKGSIKANELAIGFVKKESEATSPKTTLIIQKTSEGLKIGDASVVERDLVATNGVIHKIETLLKAPDKDVSGVIDTQSNLSYLSHTLHAEDLFTKFQGEGPFTFFAPTNAAIVALGDDTPTGQALTNGLNFHVANMIKYSFEFTHGEVIATLLANKNQTMSVEGDQVKFGEALIVKGNIQATNGVVHVIDRVQMPKP